MMARCLAALGCAVALLCSPSLPAQPSKQSAEKAQRTDKADEHPSTETNGTIASQRNEEINVSVGESHTLSAAGVRSYLVGARGIADVRLTPDSSQFVIVGEKPGSTTLLLIKKDSTQISYAINVFEIPVETVERDLFQLLEGTAGVRVRRVGARFFIEGGVSTEPELKRIEHIASLFPGQVHSLVVLGGAAAGRKINIRVDFFFLQFDRSKSYQIGVQYPGRLGGAGVAKMNASYSLISGAFTNATAAIVNQPLPGLDIAATNGWAKVLKHSAVITSNGAEAKFSSGGEQNYVVTSGLSASMSQLTFGTNVTVLPRFDPETRELEVRVDAEVADLTPTVGAGTDLPGRSLSKLATLVSLKLGQSIVLSGIRTRTERHSKSGLPFLSEIPLLGVLFGSHGNVSQELEGAILVVPSIVESIPRGAREVLDDALAQYNDFSGNVRDVHTWDATPAPPSQAAATPAPVRPARSAETRQPTTVTRTNQ